MVLISGFGTDREELITIHSVQVTHNLIDFYNICFKPSLFQTEDLQPAQWFIIWKLFYDVEIGQPHQKKPQTDTKKQPNKPTHYIMWAKHGFVRSILIFFSIFYNFGFILFLLIFFFFLLFFHLLSKADIFINYHNPITTPVWQQSG